jgi:16S rRNA (guanine527-N7)-methyltransferase
MSLDPQDFALLESTLGVGQRLGFLGPGPVRPHIQRALDLASAVAEPPARALDLGSGGGVPGLPLALLWPRSTWVLLDGSVTRSAFLSESVGDLRLADRVEVVASRAEEAGKGPLRGTFDLVVARSFAPPAVTAECGSPFLKVGGLLVVAEPPGGDTARWDPAAVSQLGLELGAAESAPTAFQVLRQIEVCPDRYPRRVGIPAKRPLF